MEDLRLQVAEQEKSETEPKRAEEGLRVKEALYGKLINSINSGVAVYRGNEEGNGPILMERTDDA